MKKILLAVVCLIVGLVLGILFWHGDDKLNCSICSDVVIVDKLLLSGDNSWRQANEKFICSEDQNYISINLPCIGNVQSQAEWIKNNKNKLEYILTRRHAEIDHRVPILNYATGDDRITLNDLKSKIKLGGGNWDTDKYDNYLNFSFDTTNKLRVDLSVNHDPQAFCFSIQLFKAIIENNALPANPTFEFKKINFASKDILVFWVLGAGGAYYDFSENPKFTKDSTGEKIIKSVK
ncbi:hypothetical protein FMM05_06035 [Flavobacterium zepuense]|uniref:Uncharacterized protein n=1 Tax=Flavobacterium zepuense TaxID=2593302 RepID=A0A552V5M6_9FLAO|nr:hypothetical protein [Flavobacterium zepuense]TRW25780.1 hypothetical protein FMM05_06035 [Flavobacterium zepuense]